MATRQGRRAAFGSVALIFALAVLALAEIAGWQGLRLRVAAIPTTLILLGINLVIAAVFGFLAARSHRGKPRGKRCRYAGKLWMPLGDRFSSPQLCRLQPHCSASFAVAVVGGRGFAFSAIGT